MRVLVTPDYRTLSRRAAEIVAEAVHGEPHLTLGLPTGNTPLGVYEELVRKHRDGHLDLSRVKTFNLDEYIGLAPGHPSSYHTYMRLHFFDHVNVPVENIRIPGGAPGMDTDLESASYEQAIHQAGGIDLLIIGIGSNGHIAFNEPGSSFTSRTRAVDLAGETRANAERYFASKEEIPRRAITVGIGTILEARRILLLASGSGKSGAVARALQGPVSEEMPASALQSHTNVTAILDQAAAKQLQRS
jgi:glucosamine-6-phosphate deaminase